MDMIEGYSYNLIGATPTCHIVDTDGWPDGWGPEANDEAAEAFNNTLNIGEPIYASAERTAFESQIMSDFATQRFAPYRFPPAGDITPVEAVPQNPLNLSYAINVTAEYDPSVLNVAAMLADSVTLYATAADAVIAEGGDPTQQASILAKVAGRTFFGLTGLAYILPDYSRLSGAVLQNIVVQEGASSTLGFVDVGIYDGFAGTYTEIATIRYPGGGTTTPVSFVANPCNLSNYEVAATQCKSDGQVDVTFVVKEGAVCSDVDHPNAHAECAYVPVNSRFGQAIITFASIGTVVCIAFLCWIGYYRNHELVRLSQPELAAGCMFGCLMLNVSSFFTVGGEGKLACTAAPRIFHLSFTLAIGALIGKLYRVWRIFENRRLRKIRIRFQDMFVVVALFVFLDIAFLTISGIFFPLHNARVAETTDGVPVEIEQLRCRGGGVFSYLLWSTKFALLLGTCVPGYSCGHVHDGLAASRGAASQPMRYGRHLWWTRPHLSAEDEGDV
uniref:G-protein coupled receptors family 3 profile domain-containing protein n=1 Tax=Pinguiococcus pyrenoidosus TaxID=172671 RepID=A0A7R9YAB2_9STRA